MTDFATWWRWGSCGSGVAALAPLLLAGCGAPPTVEAPPPPPPAPVQPAAVAPSAPAVPAGLTPLPSSRQVVAAFQVGRTDPFGSVVAAAVPGTGPGGAAAAVKQPPPAFLEQLQISGVIQSGGSSEVVASFNGESGSLRQGDRGGLDTKLLPLGWRVAAVDVGSGQLILQSGNRKVSKALPPP